MWWMMNRSVTAICNTTVIMTEPPGLPVASSSSPSLKTSVGLIEDSGRLPDPGALASPPSRPKALAAPGLAAKSSSSLFSSTPVPVRDQPAAVGKIQRVGVGDRVAGGIDNRKMGGLIALVALRIAGRDFRGGAGAIGENRRSQPFGVGLGGEALQGNAHESGVAEPARAVGVGELFRLGHFMDSRGGIEPLFANWKAFENIEDFDHVRAARGGRRHRDDLMAAIGSAHRLALDRAVIGEVVEGHPPAVLAHRRDDFLGDRPLVETIRPVRRNAVERRGEIVERDMIAGDARAEVGPEIDSRGRRMQGELLLPERQRIRDVVIDGQTLMRELRRRRDEVCERKFAGAVFAPRELQSRDRAGNADRKAAERDLNGSASPLASRNTSLVVSAGAASR